MNFNDIFKKRADTITAHYGLDDDTSRDNVQRLLSLTTDPNALDTDIIESVLGVTEGAEEGVVTMYLVLKATLHLLTKESEKINELVRLQTEAMKELEETDYNACASYNAIMVRMIIDSPLLGKDFYLDDDGQE